MCSVYVCMYISLHIYIYIYYACIFIYVSMHVYTCTNIHKPQAQRYKYTSIRHANMQPYRQTDTHAAVQTHMQANRFANNQTDNSSLAHPTHHPEGPLLKRERRKGETILVIEKERERKRERERERERRLTPLPPFYSEWHGWWWQLALTPEMRHQEGSSSPSA